jgi:hypothetical protein
VSAPGAPSPAMLAALVTVGHELAARARRLGAERLAVELAGVAGPLWLTCERGVVRAVGEGFDIELSALAQWPGTRAPGA